MYCLSTLSQYDHHLYLASFLAVYVYILCPIINVIYNPNLLWVGGINVEGGNTFFKVDGGGTKLFSR